MRHRFPGPADLDYLGDEGQHFFQIETQRTSIDWVYPDLARINEHRVREARLLQQLHQLFGAANYTNLPFCNLLATQLNLESVIVWLPIGQTALNGHASDKLQEGRTRLQKERRTRWRGEPAGGTKTLEAKSLKLTGLKLAYKNELA